MKLSTQSVVDNPHEMGIHPRVEDPPMATRPQGIGWLWLFWEQRRFLGRVTVRGLIAAIIVAILLPPRYSSTTRLMPPDQSGGAGMLAAMAGSALGSSSTSGGGGAGALGGSLGGLAGDMLGLKTSGALFVEMLHSRTVQDAMIKQFDLRKVYWDRYWETARKDLTKRTTITEDKKSGVIEIEVSDRSQQRAQQMAQAYVDELDRLVAQVSTSSARRERIFLEQRLVGVKQDLERDSTALSQYESANTVLDLPSQAKAMVESAALLQGQLIAAQSELQGLQQIYTPENVRVRSLQARVSELRSQLAKIGGAKTIPGQEPDGAHQEQAAGDLYPSLRQLPLLGVRWLDLYRQAKIEETVYELLTKQYEMAKVQEAKEIPTVKVLDAANWPERASFPPRAIIIPLGTFFALCLGLAWVAGLALWNSGDPNSSGRQLALEVGAEIKHQWDRVLHRLLRRRETA